MDNQSDSSLMKLVQAGDTAQLALLFERHHLALFRYLFGLTSNRALSEDLVQEVFFRVLKYAQTYNTSLTFPAWIYGMGRNAYFDLHRKRRREVPQDPETDVRSEAPMQEEVITRQQDVQFLQEALQRLPEDKREVLMLSRFHDLRYDAIANILQCEVSTVKGRVFRALKELRENFCQLRGEKIYDA
ncbi:MAG TPA: RNA polymerase sigma factor [Bryobacteraceae bacterium]